MLFVQHSPQECFLSLLHFLIPTYSVSTRLLAPNSPSRGYNNKMVENVFICFSCRSFCVVDQKWPFVVLTSIFRFFSYRCINNNNNHDEVIKPLWVRQGKGEDWPMPKRSRLIDRALHSTCWRKREMTEREREREGEKETESWLDDSRDLAQLWSEHNHVIYEGTLRCIELSRYAVHLW